MNKPVLFFSMLLAASSLLFSCGGDEPDNPYVPDEPTNTEKPEPSVNIEEIVKNNVSVKATYSNFTFTFVITSTVKSKLPSHKVEYAIGHGLSFFKPETLVSEGNDAYYYNLTKSGNTETVTFKNPFWFYYVCGEYDGDKWAKCEMYYKSYIALIEMGLSNLTESEKALYNDIIESFTEYEYEVRRYYRPSVEVLVDHKYYKVATYSIP